MPGPGRVLFGTHGPGKPARQCGVGGLRPAAQSAVGRKGETFLFQQVLQQRQARLRIGRLGNHFSQ